MKKTGILILLALLLSGCSWMGGSYVHVVPHSVPGFDVQPEMAAASDYNSLRDVLCRLVESGVEKTTIYVHEYPENAVLQGMQSAVGYIRTTDPIGAYAVEDIQYELGEYGGKAAIALQIEYSARQSELRNILRVFNMEQAAAVLQEALESCDSKVIMRIENYSAVDFEQMVIDYARKNPNRIMELPTVTETICGKGISRLVELQFTYENSRETLRGMQQQVKPVFDAAVLYVSGEGSSLQKYSQLCSFLMERFEYQIETSNTPAYSLLRYGVGDSRAFATVYAAMCRLAGLECRTVTGTKHAENYSWNLIHLDSGWRHLDVLEVGRTGRFQVMLDDQMAGFVWDYSAYPAASQAQADGVAPAVSTEPAQMPDPTEEATDLLENAAAESK